MNVYENFRGAAPVGQLEELPLLEMTAIIYFRMMAGSFKTRKALEKDFTLAFGADHGGYYFKRFEEFFVCLATKSRRKVMHHEVECTCFGGDESVIANMISLAAIGDIKDAELFAYNLVSGDTAVTLVAHADNIGLALRIMLERYPVPIFSLSQKPPTTH